MAQTNGRDTLHPAAESGAATQKASKRRVALTVLAYLVVIALLATGAVLLFTAINGTPQAEPVGTVPEQTEPEASAPPAQTETELEPALSTEAPTEPPAGAYIPDTALLDAMEINPDVIALLRYGSDSALFIPQAADNTFYLSHDDRLNGSWTGAAFFDYRNTLAPRDTNVMIHGHNMRNNLIFGNLVNFYDPLFLARYPIFTLETATGRELYVPYAITDVEVDPLASAYFKITEWNFATDADFEAYVGYLTANSRYTLPIKAAPGDQLLTLATCNYIGSDGRLLICLRKLHEDESVALVTAQIQQALGLLNPNG